MITIDDIAERQFLDQVLDRSSGGLTIEELESWYQERFGGRSVSVLTDVETWNNLELDRIYVPLVYEGGVVKRIDALC
ncbi:MAG TPA: hypothetical protein PLZ99_01635 [Parcubacteria group bacterium]|nr:hypothetical protein [Parcubacteria group bacterium]